MAHVVVVGAASDILGGIMTDAPALGASPIQARSLNRVQNILDAAASIIDRDGVEALTPTEIAYLSGSSVPSVYR